MPVMLGLDLNMAQIQLVIGRVLNCLRLCLLCYLSIATRSAVGSLLNQGILPLAYRMVGEDLHHMDLQTNFMPTILR